MPVYIKGLRLVIAEIDGTDPGPGLSSEVYELCAKLEIFLIEFVAAQVQLNDEDRTGSPEVDVEAALSRIRAARWQCEKIADCLLQIRPNSPQEDAAVNNMIAVYLEQVDVDRLTYNPRFNVTHPDSRRQKLKEASPAPKAARMFPLSILPWKRWPMMGSPPKSR